MPGIVHVKKRLTDISIRFPQEQEYCGQDFFPRKNVDHLEDFIVKWNKANIQRLDELAMSAPDDALPPEVELIPDADDSYRCRVYAVRSPDKVITKRNADPALDYDIERSLAVRERLDVRLEYLRVKQVLRNTAIMTNNTTLTVAQRWDNTGSGTSLPVSFVRNIIANLKTLNGGKLPNCVRMTTYVKNAIVQSEEFKDFTKFAGLGLGGKPVGDEDAIALAWGLAPGSVKTSDATYTVAAPTVPPSTATQSAATPVSRTFLGSDVVLAYVQAPGIRTYGLGAEFRFSGYNTDPYSIIIVPQLNRGAIPGEDIRGISILDPKVYNANSGYLIKGVVDASAAAYLGFLD
jgi:hypothetical protein